MLHVFKEELAQVVMRLPDELKALGAVMTVGDYGFFFNFFAMLLHVGMMLVRRVGLKEGGSVCNKAIRRQRQVPPGRRAQGGYPAISCSGVVLLKLYRGDIHLA